MPRAEVEWSLNKDPDLMVDIWSTAALVQAVIAALLEEPENVRRALRALGTQPGSRAPRGSSRRHP